MKKLLFVAIGLMMSFTTLAQWSDDPAVNNPITDPNFGINEFEIEATAGKVTYICYDKLNGSSITYYLQILDSAGVKLFADPGLVVSNNSSLTSTEVNTFLSVDRQGNAVIAVIDTRNTSARHAHIYKVGPDGTVIWNGIDLSPGNDVNASTMQMLALSDGKMLFAWTAGSYVHFQAITSAGTLAWTEQQVTTAYSSYPHLVNSGEGFILLYSERNGSGMPWTRYSHLKAMKYDGTGSAVWTTPTVIYTGGYSSVALQTVFDVISDEQGGLFVGWYDAHIVSAREDAYISHLLSDGSFGFTTTVSGTTGIRIGDNANYRSFSPKLALDAANDNLFVTWHETNVGQTYYRLMAQKVTVSTGIQNWNGNSGIQLDDNSSASTLGYKSIQTARDGNVALFYMKMIVANGNTQNYARLLNDQGVTVWTAPIAFSTPQNYKAGLLSTPLITNTHWLTLWQDNRITGGYATLPLYLQRINIDGTLGEYIPPVVPDTCFAPAGLSVSDLDIHSATVSWTGDAIGYRFEHQIATDTNWDTQDITSTTVSLTGLEAETLYNYRVKSLCDTIDSDWVNGTFTTLEELGIHEVSRNLFEVNVVNNQIIISNPNRYWIESVKIYAVNGVLLTEKQVKNRNNVTLAIDVSTSIVLVVVDSKGQTWTKKVLIKN